MSSVRPAWFNSPLGRLVRFVGSIKFAIPLMVIFSIAMVWGTWVESTQTRRAAFDTVYAAPWFVALNALICLSLIAAVVTRYPWKRRHIGFATVHAGMITVAVGGFISVFTKVEGQMVLQEGRSTNLIDIPDTEQIETIRFENGQFVADEQVPIERTTREIAIADMAVRILERWPNAEPVQVVENDGSEPRHAVELAFDASSEEGTWLSETDADDPRLLIAGLQIRVLPDGQPFTGPTGPTLEVADADADADAPEAGGGPAAETPPPSAPSGPSALFVIDGVSYALDAVVGRGDDLVGTEAFPGWVIRSATVLNNAVVGPDGLTEGDPGLDNPAIELTIARADGSSVERHIAFARFPDLATARVMSGDQPSGASLRFTAPETTPASSNAGPATGYRLVFEATDEHQRAILIQPGGTVASHDLTGAPPHDIPLPFGGGGAIRVLNQYRTAQFKERLVQAPALQDQTFPVLVVEATAPDGERREIQLAYKRPTPFAMSDDSGMLMLRYGPEYMALPFHVHLDDFRKMDYPGSETAMAYESDVRVLRAGSEQWEPVKIHMNHPLVSDGWKVYQASFVGDTVSIFSVATDPGLIVIYPGSIILCTGIAIVFFSRRWSRGHPGISRGKFGRSDDD